MWTWKGRDTGPEIAIGASGREQATATLSCCPQDPHIIGQIVYKVQTTRGLPLGLRRSLRVPLGIYGNTDDFIANIET
eukprot:321316-Amphidinium_carterae.1